ncbi:hypothetical protein ACR3LR_08580 [Pantoea eucalypti]|uniref:hypothetical protein n=1 Tax=Pantoea eucalypti TaxID=470933 RepID=UPI003EE4E368
MSKLRVDQLSPTDDSVTINVADLAKTGPSALVFDQNKSRNFWIDVHPEARIHRMNDRLFMGDASDNDGKITSERNPSNKDWLELTRSSTTNNATLVALSQIGQGAIIGGSRSSDSGLADSLGCIGIQGWGINDNALQVQTAYAAYFEARRHVGAGRTHCFELDMINYGDAVGVQPYDMFQQGLTAGAWIASGGELSATKASVAIAIMNNGSTWDKGIVFHSTSLEGTDGISGFGVALEMAKNQGFRWMFGDGSVGATVSSSVSTGNTTQSLNFSDGGLLYRNVEDKNMFQIGVSNNYVNGASMTPGPSGIGPTLSAQGDDINIDLRLATKGTGMLDLRGSGTVASAGSAAGDIQIKLNGEVYRIAVKK